jgi:hypothetical protein
MDGVSLALLALYALATLAGWGFAMADLRGRNDLSGWHKPAAFLVILLLPVIGAALYYIFRPPLRPRLWEQADKYTEEQLAVFADLRRKGVVTYDEYERERAALVSIAQVQSASRLEP